MRVESYVRYSPIRTRFNSATPNFLAMSVIEDEESWPEWVGLLLK